MKTDATGQLVKPEGREALKALIQRMRPELERALPRHISADRIARIALTALTNNERLGHCTPGSFIGCLLQLSQLGLEPNTPLGHAYLIPRNNKNLPPGQLECTYIVGYQGMMELSRRTKEVKDIYADLVREGDDFAYQLGTDRWIKHTPSSTPGRAGRKVTHVYAVGELQGGGRPFVVLTEEEVQARRKRSVARDSGPWVTDPDAMRLKTGVRALWRWLPKSAEMAMAEVAEHVAETGRALAGALDDSVAHVLEHAQLSAGVADAEVEDEGGGAGNGEGGPAGGTDAPPAPVATAAAVPETPADPAAPNPYDRLIDLCGKAAKKFKAVITKEAPAGSGKVFFVHATIYKAAGFTEAVKLSDNGEVAVSDADAGKLAAVLDTMLNEVT